MMWFHEFAVNNIHDMTSDLGDSESEIYGLRLKNLTSVKYLLERCNLDFDTSDDGECNAIRITVIF